MNRICCLDCGIVISYSAAQATQLTVCPKCDEEFTLPELPTVACPHCQKKSSYDYDQVGTSINCNKCKRPIQLPSEDALLSELKRQLGELVMESLLGVALKVVPGPIAPEAQRNALEKVTHLAAQQQAEVDQAPAKNRIAKALSKIAYYKQIKERAANPRPLAAQGGSCSVVFLIAILLGLSGILFVS